TVAGMAADGAPFTGFLYAGLMIGADGAPKVIEFNVRFGDRETQPVMMRLRSDFAALVEAGIDGGLAGVDAAWDPRPAMGARQVVEFDGRLGDPETQPVMMRLRSDFAALVEAGIDGGLAGVDAEWDPRPALGVVMPAEGYPGTPRTGDAINSLDVLDVEDTKVFHAGTRLEGAHAVTAGGRVLCVCALGDTVADAQARAYAAVAGISWPGEFHRHDIGWRAIARERG